LMPPAAPVAPAAVEPPPREMPAPAEVPVPRSAPRNESWSERVLAGEFPAVLREARRRGIEEVLRREDAPDLMALAEASRYSGVTPLARRALSTVRARFPGSLQAHKAAFLLGRMAEDGDGDLAGALAWYSRYLEDAPGGKMTATLRLSGQARARPLAEEYLRRFPTGSYASPARAILSPP